MVRQPTQIMTQSKSQNFLFLQGPLSPYYAEIAAHLLEAGHTILRINFSGNDDWDWPHANKINYRGQLKDWPAFLEKTLRTHAIDHIICHGDRRPYHKPAYHLAKKMGIALSATELGYLRPDWMTLEPYACSTRSHFTNNPDQLLAFAQDLPEVPTDLKFPEKESHKIKQEFRFTLSNLLLRWKYPHYQTHRSVAAWRTYSGWAYGKLSKLIKNRILSHFKPTKPAQSIKDLGDNYFVFALQLEGDFQLRDHSPFTTRQQALSYIFSSFGHKAPKGSKLVVKPHPLETSPKSLKTQIEMLAGKYDFSDRLLIVEDIPITPLCQQARGFVTINSSAGFEALQASCPAFCVMPTLYDLAGLTFQGNLDDFWNKSQTPNTELLNALRKSLAHSIQLRGTLYNHQGRKQAAKETAKRLIERDHFSSPVIENAPPRLAKAAKMGVHYQS